jgi:hypothetical protein
MVSFWDRTGDINDYNSNYVVAFSKDEGESFKIVNASSQTTDFRTVANLNGEFGIGEYNALLSTKGYAIPIWADGRTGDGDLNIYCAFIPLDFSTNAVVERVTSVDADYSLLRPASNPTGGAIKIGFNLESPMEIILSVLDVNGNIIEKIADGHYSIGNFTFEKDLAYLPSGVYYLKLDTENGYALEKFIINK